MTPPADPDDTPPRPVYDAVVLAGGRATRLGGTAKARLVVDGAQLLDRALAAGAAARRLVVVGTPDLASDVGGRGPVVQEDPPFGGPVAGLAAGLRVLGAPAAPWVLLLAVDVPRAALAVAALERAVAHDPAGDGAHLVRAGRAQWLVGLYRRAALEAALTGVDPDGASMRRLVGALRCAEVPDEAGWSDDVDTPADAARLGARPADDLGGHDRPGAPGSEPPGSEPPGGTRDG